MINIFVFNNLDASSLSHFSQRLTLKAIDLFKKDKFNCIQINDMRSVPELYKPSVRVSIYHNVLYVMINKGSDTRL